MQGATVTQEQITKEWLDNLKICLCGQTITHTNPAPHKGCIISGIARKLFTDLHGWEEYCKENGQRIAPYYNNSVYNTSLPG
jgi:hypothetical protein